MLARGQYRLMDAKRSGNRCHRLLQASQLISLLRIRQLGQRDVQFFCARLGVDQFEQLIAALARGLGIAVQQLFESATVQWGSLSQIKRETRIEHPAARTVAGTRLSVAPAQQSTQSGLLAARKPLCRAHGEMRMRIIGAYGLLDRALAVLVQPCAAAQRFEPAGQFRMRFQQIAHIIGGVVQLGFAQGTAQPVRQVSPFSSGTPHSSATSFW